MVRIVWPRPIPTRIVRTPVAGPRPANTLAYIECRTAGFEAHSGELGDTARAESEFATEFRIDGYQQQRHDWYLENTIVSATVMLRAMNTDTDLSFLIAVDRIEPILGLDGTLRFVCEMAFRTDDNAWFAGDHSLTFDAAVSAYVLCYEPHVTLPPSGAQSGHWNQSVDRDFLTPRRKYGVATDPDGSGRLRRSRHRPRSRLADA